MGFVCLLALSCNLPGYISERETATSTSTSAPQHTPTPTPTLTPTPLPTPIPAVRIEGADRALFIGDWETALREYQATIETNPDMSIQTAAILGIARTYILVRDYPSALNHLRFLLENYPDSPHLADAYFTIGRTYFELDRHQEAAQAFESYLALRPGLIDTYILEWVGDSYFAIGEYQQAIEAYQGAINAPHLSDELIIQAKIGQAYVVMGDVDTAIQIFTDVYQRTTNDYTKAEMGYRIGTAYLQSGRAEEGYAAYLDAVTNYPRSYFSYLGLVDLVGAGIPVNEFDRGLVDYFAAQYGVALAAFDRYMETMSPEHDGAIHYYRGHTLRRLGEYQAAIDEWDVLIDTHPNDAYWIDAWEDKAFTLWAYLDQYTNAAQTLLDFVAILPEHAMAPEFLFDAARIYERAGNLSEAASLWERIPQNYPNATNTFQAQFLGGITRYRLGDYAAAEASFRTALGIAQDTGQQAAAYLWIGKSQQRQGNTQGATASWQQAEDSDPTGYYSERASDLLLGREPFTPPPAYDLNYDAEMEKAEAESWMRMTFNISEEVDLSSLGELANDPRMIRGTELWHLGMYETARMEFENLRVAMQNDPINTFRLANFFAEIGLYRSTILAARHVLTLAGMDNTATMDAPVYFNRLRFGAYYWDLIIPIAQAYGFDPLFIFSITRQESFFEGFITSSAGARGLMQIIPSTGQGIADRAGWPPNYTAEDLYNPKINVTFGTDYLSAQENYFDGDLYAALAAYNGGPGNSAIWKELAPDDIDLFVEVIRFQETHRYIKVIAEVFAIYRRIYAVSP